MSGAEKSLRLELRMPRTRSWITVLIGVGAMTDVERQGRAKPVILAG
jgi:hypothetical protein